MKIIGNTLENIHKFRHENIRDKRSGLLPTKKALVKNPYARLSLLYLDTNDTYYLVDASSAIANSLRYQDGAVEISAWTATDIVGLKQSYAQSGFDNYFQMLVQNTAEAYDNEKHQDQ
ncbi:hypothetical protein JOC36_001585 [Weissella uvarum]|uniref:hypothetical protein n=1 Tax=Weissella uvarum TaxID=1479233 RepID=UPI00195F785B|nr:hypothetical protein [Weissella uvarum]MBM7617991.1 hypothetical protein [Weissella uvarum]MCM0596210.1 hypothetical protein [Weissella uvarum]